MFASITRSTAGVVQLASSATLAFTPSAMSVSKQSLARASAALVALPPAQVSASLSTQARASKYVASASPMPETVRRTGEAAITVVSMSTISGLAGRKR